MGVCVCVSVTCTGRQTCVCVDEDILLIGAEVPDLHLVTVSESRIKTEVGREQTALGM